jgi:thiamine-phosphate pyrophosphorylase
MTVRAPLDLSLFLVIGPGDTRGRPIVDIVRAAVRGGVTAVQLRRKDDAAGAFVEEARALVAELRPLDIPLIVNDRVDVALAADADGVHVGQQDMSVADVRRIGGERMLVGLSVTSMDEARAVPAYGVNYVGVGPVFATVSKPDAAAPLGVEGTRGVCAVLSVPCVAIGGVGIDNIDAVLSTGVAGVAVISAICAAASPHAAAVELSERIARRRVVMWR